MYDNWIFYSKKLGMYCKLHNVFFKVGGSCDKCPHENNLSENNKSLTTAKPTHNDNQYTKKSPSFPMQTKKENDTDLVINSYGKGYNHTEKVINSLGVVINLQQNGYNQAQIAMKLGVSQPYINKILKTFKNNNLQRKQRFHNFSLKYTADFDFARLPFKTIKLNKFSNYKYYADDDFKIQFFNNGTITIRTTKDIFHENIVKTEVEAIRYVTDFLLKWNKYNISFLNYIVISGHNAFLNNEIAKDCQKKGDIIKYYDKDDNKLRTNIDMSKGVPEFEHEHNKHFVSDSKKWERIIHDVATDNYYPPSTTKEILDITLKVQGDYAENIKKHLLVQDKTLIALEGINTGITSLKEVIIDMKQKEYKKEKEETIMKWRKDNNLY